MVGDNFVKIDGFVAVGAGRVALGLVIEAEFAEGVRLVADNEGRVRIPGEEAEAVVAAVGVGDDLVPLHK